jgi:tetrahydromethanopterin S-methyltransferase subunit G
MRDLNKEMQRRQGEAIGKFIGGGIKIGLIVIAVLCAVKYLGAD